MKVDFTLGPFNVETMKYKDYLRMIQNLREELGVRHSHGRPVLADQHNPPTLFFDLILRTNHHSVSFRFRSDNLYLLGYVPVDENNKPLTHWLEFDNLENGQLVHLITEDGTDFLSFEGRYGALARAANQSIQKMRFGVYKLRNAINELAVTEVRQDRACSLVVVIMMISEATRFIRVFDHMAQGFDNPDTSFATECQIKPWIMKLVHDWESMSKAILRAKELEEREELIEKLGILLAVGGGDGVARSNITLTGPSESVSAFGNVTIKLLLTDDKNKISWDDGGINPGISWHAANIGDVYDKLIPRKIDSIIGSVTVNYAVLQNAVAATVTVSLKGEGQHTAGVYGLLSACYGKWVDRPGATSLLFNIPSEKNCVKEKIPLLRCVVAVPMNDSLRVTARSYDHDPISNNNVEIADGTVEFPVQETIPAECNEEYIIGRDGNGVQVTIDWSSGF
ncbi:hypothetical protein K1719_034598 [Acacia pycnantha]|nr:hypothetical protein K1719_034598 [Acacia pycnantha]